MADEVNPFPAGSEDAAAWNIANKMSKKLDRNITFYQTILDKRAAQYGKDVLPTWQKVEKFLDSAIKAIYAKYGDISGNLSPVKLTEANRLRELQKITISLVRTLEGQADLLQNHIAYSYVDSAIFHTWGLEVATQVAVVAPILTYTHVMGVINNPWLPDAKTYSDRLRANTAYLAAKMNETVLEATDAGWDIPTAARRVQEVAGEGYDNAVRLARTEINRASSQASSHSFIQNADILGSKRWVATLDAKTAAKDADNDGKKFDLAYDTPEVPGVPGKRIPNHPNCRCKYSPVVDGMSAKIRERIARGDGDTLDNFGKRYYTKAQTYREYAKERGLPDLDERLAKDNPKKYLRRGEKLPA